MSSDTGDIVLPPLSHIGVVVEDIENTTKLLSPVLGIGSWEIFEAKLKKEEMLEGEPCTLNVARSSLGSILIELIQTVEGKSLWADFLETKGEGIHHIAYSVSNWDDVASKIKQQGCTMLIGGIAPNGKRWAYFRVNPGGIIVEVEEMSDEGKPTLTLES